MKIAYLSTSAIPSTAANSIHVMKMCAAFSKQGNSVDLYASKSAQINYCKTNFYKYYGVDNSFNIIKTIKPFFRGGSTIYRFFSNFKLMFKRYDLFYARNYHHAKSALFLKIPVIIEVHDRPSDKRAIKTIKKVVNSKKFAGLVTISQALKDEYLYLYPELKNKKVIVAHDCADIPQKTIKKKDNDAIAIGYVGHLYEGRGAEIIIEMAKRFSNTMFYIVGGLEKDIQRVKSICRLPNVVFEGFVPNGELYRYYCKFDIVLAPYQKKVSVAGGGGDTSKYMSPLKIFEYMAYKKAIVCSDIPVLHEVLADRNNCLLCDCSDLDAWELAINLLIEDHNLRNQLIDSAYQDFLKNYTWDMRAKRLLTDL